MEFIIKNEYLEARIDNQGAELVSLKDSNGNERMHDPEEDSWKRVSPILFPQISATPGLKYTVDGKEYIMPKHGFLRDIELDALEHGYDYVVFKLTQDALTIKNYPYMFEITITYRLIKNRLVVEFKVVNTNDKKLLFMLGGHPGFKIPLFENETYDDYYLKFEYPETIEAMQVINGYIANEYKPYLNNEDTINISHSVFNPDALIFKNLKSHYVDLLSKKSDFDIRFYFEDFEILAIWSTQRPEDKFVCLEPWNGIQKEFVLEHEKMGVLELEAHQTYECSYTIEIVK